MTKKGDYVSELSDWWAGSWGDEYTRRNRVNWRARIPFWDRIVQMTGIRSAFEVGCNAGWNLSAIKHTNHGYNVCSEGCDLNGQAVIQANAAGCNATCEEMQFIMMPEEYEMVFTSGVLIHVAPDDLPTMMKNIVEASCDYVLAIEYESEVEEEVEYRGHTGKLWKRPYGKLYEAMGLTLVETGLLGEQDGFDPNGVTYWLLRK